MATVQDMVNAAMRRIGALAGGEVANATDSQDVLFAMNNLLDSWSIERGNIPYLTTETLALTGAESYTLGTSGTPSFSTARPVEIDPTSFISVGGIDYPVTILTRDEYFAIQDKGQSGSPEAYLYYDATYPNGTLYVWPVSSGTLTLASWKQLTTYTSLATTMTLPPGYWRALELSLAEDITSMFDLPMPKNLAQQAKQARRAIKHRNSPALSMRMPRELVGKRRFNIITGQ